MTDEALTMAYVDGFVIPVLRENRDAYLKMYGNICYDTRDQYVNFPWSSETK